MHSNEIEILYVYVCVLLLPFKFFETNKQNFSFSIKVKPNTNGTATVVCIYCLLFNWIEYANRFAYFLSLLITGVCFCIYTVITECMNSSQIFSFYICHMYIFKLMIIPLTHSYLYCQKQKSECKLQIPVSQLPIADCWTALSVLFDNKFIYETQITSNSYKNG